MSNASLIYITCKNAKEAHSIASELLQERLVACANLIKEISSIYHWQGKIEADSESLLICKTQTQLVDKIILKVKELHSYDCPCIVSLPLQNGNPDFLNWIVAETGNT